MQSRIISACGLGWRAFHALLVRVMFTSPVLANHGGCSCLYVECDRFGGDKRWCQSVGKYLHIVGILVGGSMGGLSSPGCYCRRGPVRGLMLSVSLVLPAYHSRGLGGQGLAFGGGVSGECYYTGEGRQGRGEDVILGGYGGMC